MLNQGLQKTVSCTSSSLRRRGEHLVQHDTRLTHREYRKHISTFRYCRNRQNDAFILDTRYNKALAQQRNVEPILVFTSKKLVLKLRWLNSILGAQKEVRRNII